MIRTQVTLDKDLYSMLKVEAHASGMSIAEFVRRTLRQAVSSGKQPGWMSFFGLADSGLLGAETYARKRLNRRRIEAGVRARTTQISPS
jgi:hypothetical protein